MSRYCHSSSRATCLIALVIKECGCFSLVKVTKAKFVPTRPGQDYHTGWVFGDEGEEPHVSPDPINGAKFVRDLYEMADKESSAKVRFCPLC